MEKSETLFSLVYCSMFSTFNMILNVLLWSLKNFAEIVITKRGAFKTGYLGMYILICTLITNAGLNICH